MDENKAKSIADTIVKDVFGIDNPWSLAELQQMLCFDVDLPTQVTCVFSNETAWVYHPQPGQRFVKQDALEAHAAEKDMMRNKRPIDSIDDIKKYWDEINYMTAEKVVVSQDVAKSDSITSSSAVFYSSLVGSSKNIILSENVYNSNYLLASKGDNSCNLGIRVMDSIYCSSSFEVRWSNKVSKSFFITDCLDLYECMFCYGIKSKKYCIANMQYEKEEYLKIKQQVIEWIVNEKIKKLA